MSVDERVGYFDRLAPTWDAEGLTAEAMIEGVEAAKQQLELAAGDHVLEVGCGTGKLTGWLVDHVRPGRVTALDFSPCMIAQARAKDLDADFLCADVCCDDLGSRRYDVIFCFHSFPHFRDQPAALTNFARALKSDGRLIVMHLAGSEQINAFHASLDGPVSTDLLPEPQDWPNLLNDAGFELRSFADGEEGFFLLADLRE